MRIQKIVLKNWRNFRNADVEIEADVIYLVGPNASGKSNFLDALRFLRDIAKPIGGGLQTALNERGGFSKVRCLHARGAGKLKGMTNLEITVSLLDGANRWTYHLAILRKFNNLKPLVVEEKVEFNDRVIIKRPNDHEIGDEDQLAVTYLEQAAQNKEFRDLSKYFAQITYVHLVPQLVKFGERISGHLLPDDPFGQAFMKRISDTPNKTREARLKKISKALHEIVPGLEALHFLIDIDGRPHIEMRYQTHRPYPAKQLEDQLSDGTLRLVALLWLLQEDHSAPLLLEEPELSLNEEIVKQLHRLFQRIGKRENQVFVTTHSYALLSNEGIPSGSIFKIIPSAEGSRIEPPTQTQRIAIQNGVPPGDVVLSSGGQFMLDI